MSVAQKDIGVQFQLNTGINIATATTANIHYRKPSGTTGSFTGATASGTHVVYTTTDATQLDEAGVWELQAYVVTPSWTLRGTIAKIRVVEALKP
jgi:hypothetical protein